MNAILESHFEVLEKQRHQILSEIKTLSNQALNRSQPNKWSISQIIGHVVAAEKLSVGYINKKIIAINEVENTGLWNDILLWIFTISQRLPLKYKAPKTLGSEPPSYSNVASLIIDWDETRLKLHELLEKIPANGLKKKIYRHPVMGRCNILQALVSFQEHLRHHHPQIKRLL